MRAFFFLLLREEEGEEEEEDDELLDELLDDELSDEEELLDEDDDELDDDELDEEPERRDRLCFLLRRFLSSTFLRLSLAFFLYSSYADSACRFSSSSGGSLGPVLLLRFLFNRCVCDSRVMYTSSDCLHWYVQWPVRWHRWHRALR